jgi:hypothetical protein
LRGCTRTSGCRSDHVGDRVRLVQEHDMAAGDLSRLSADPAGDAAQTGTCASRRNAASASLVSPAKPARNFSLFR